MVDQEREKQGNQPHPAHTNGKIEVRPRNWLVSVILLTLREHTSYGYELMNGRPSSGSRR